jgi:glycosyltransferase involved in cell wall biosynthesis
VEPVKKKKILILTNYCGAFTGFGKQVKEFLTYCYRKYSDKFDFVLAAAGMTEYHPDFERWPWRTIGVLPGNQDEINHLQKDPNMMRMASYGDMNIEKIVLSEKPDIILAQEDEWGCNFLKNKRFFKHVPCVFHVTLDSLPILKDALDTASKGPYYWTWSEFAAREMRDKHGLKHVKCQYPCVNTSAFHRLTDDQRMSLRERFGIPKNSFITGFVSRNQIRKLFPKLIEGYSVFKRKNPNIKNSFLYFHTHFGEGWNIPDLLKQYGVDSKELLCTYVCQETKNYYVGNYDGEKIRNGAINKDSLVTPSTTLGVTESQLNEIYNLFDFYCHPATSGATELGICEAAATELIIGTSNYSFGEDVIRLNKASINLEFDLYTEIGTQFLKSSQRPESIAAAIEKVYKMDPIDKRQLESRSRVWVKTYYGVESNADKIIAELDNIPLKSWNFDGGPELKNPDAIVERNPDDRIWLKCMYKEILCMEVSDADSGLNYWLDAIKNGMNRGDIETFFKKTAVEENAKLQQKSLSLGDLIDHDDPRKRILVVMPESAGDVFITTALFKSIRDRYNKEEWAFYFATKPEFFDLARANPYIDKVIPYDQSMDNLLHLEGIHEHKGFFDVAYLPHLGTQRALDWMHNASDKHGLDLAQNQS